MWRLIAATMLALAASPTPVLAAPQGAPTRLRSSIPGDHAARPSSLAESWAVRLVDPRSQAWIEIRVARDPQSRSVRLLGIDGTGRTIDDSFGASELAADRSSLTATAADGRLEIRDGGKRISAAAAAATGTLRLRKPARGPAAFGWRFGATPRPPDWRKQPVTASWSMLVATSVARGSLLLRDQRRIDLDGWRASYEHAWGDLLAEDDHWQYADEAIVHGRTRNAWVLHGLNRTDTITGPGARDAQWLGLLARIKGRRMTICRPRIDRRRWLATYPELHLWATRTRARCSGIALNVRDKPGRYDEYTSHLEIRGRTAAGRRAGFAAHFTHPYH